MEGLIREGPGGLLFGKETGEILGCAFEVLRILGCGLNEKPYENALCEEFRQRGIPFSQQERFEVFYKGAYIGLFIPDLIAFDKVIIEVKTIDRIGRAEESQVINYLRIARKRVGLDLNFERSRLEWKRIAL